MKENLDMQGCIELAEAIVAKAGEDYIEYRRDLETIKEGKERDLLLKKLNEVERFFRSRWFTVLTELDGKKFKATLDEKYEELKKSGELYTFNKGHLYRV